MVHPGLLANLDFTVFYSVGKNDRLEMDARRDGTLFLGVVHLHHQRQPANPIFVGYIFWESDRTIRKPSIRLPHVQVREN